METLDIRNAFYDTLEYLRSSEMQGVLIRTRKNTLLYPENFCTWHHKPLCNGEVAVIDRTPVETCEKFGKVSKTAVLLAGDPENPGESARKGIANSESELCICTSVYPCLTSSEQGDAFYTMNARVNKNTYTDRVLYVREVPIIKTKSGKMIPFDRRVSVDIISIAMPLETDPSAALNIYKNRIKNMLDAAIEEGVKIIILNAFNKHDKEAKTIAKAYAETIREGHYEDQFEKMIFAIEDYETRMIFSSTFGKQQEIPSITPAPMQANQAEPAVKETEEKVESASLTEPKPAVNDEVEAIEEVKQVVSEPAAPVETEPVVTAEPETAEVLADQETPVMEETLDKELEQEVETAVEAKPQVTAEPEEQVTDESEDTVYLSGEPKQAEPMANDQEDTVYLPDETEPVDVSEQTPAEPIGEDQEEPVIKEPEIAAPVDTHEAESVASDEAEGVKPVEVSEPIPVELVTEEKEAVIAREMIQEEVQDQVVEETSMVKEPDPVVDEPVRSYRYTVREEQQSVPAEPIPVVEEMPSVKPEVPTEQLEDEVVDLGSISFGGVEEKQEDSVLSRCEKTKVIRESKAFTSYEGELDGRAVVVAIYGYEPTQAASWNAMSKTLLERFEKLAGIHARGFTEYPCVEKTKSEQGEQIVVIAQKEPDGILMEKLAGKLSNERAMHYMRQIAEGMKVLHEHDLPVSVVSPANFKVTMDGNIHFIAGRIRTMQNTPVMEEDKKFMLPGVVEDEVRASLYAIGAMTYYLLNGTLYSEEGVQRHIAEDPANSAVYRMIYFCCTDIEQIRIKDFESLVKEIENS